MHNASYRIMENILLEQTHATLPALYGLVAEQLQRLSGSAVCSFSLYDPEARDLTTQSLIADKPFVTKILSVLEKGVIGLKTQVSPQMLSQMMEVRIKNVISLSEATEGSIPPAAAKVLQAITGIDRFIGLSFLVDGQVYGTALMGMKAGIPDPPPDMLCFFASMTSIAFRGKQNEERLTYVSQHDELTGLFNRRHFYEVLEKLQSTGQFPLVLMMMDVDNLKQINDRYGHLAGDEALARFAKHVSGQLAERMVFSRLGGDEFVLISPGDDEKSGMLLMETIRTAIAELPGNGRSIPMQVSLGMAVARDGSDKLMDLLHEADLRMYADKKERRMNTRDYPGNSSRKGEAGSPA